MNSILQLLQQLGVPPITIPSVAAGDLPINPSDPGFTLSPTSKLPLDSLPPIDVATGQPVGSPTGQGVSGVLPITPPANGPSPSSPEGSTAPTTPSLPSTPAATTTGLNTAFFERVALFLGLGIAGAIALAELLAPGSGTQIINQVKSAAKDAALAG